jgi:hypothetical protein
VQHFSVRRIHLFWKKNQANNPFLFFFFLIIFLSPGGVLVLKHVTMKASSTSSPTSSPSFTPAKSRSWNITRFGTIKQISAASNDMMRLQIPYNTSNRDYGAEVYTSDCVTPFSTVNGSAPFQVNPSSSHSLGDGFIYFNVIMDMNTTAIEQTNHWNLHSDGTNGGWAVACVEVYLSLPEGDQVVNKHQLITASVSYEGGLQGHVDDDDIIQDGGDGGDGFPDVVKYGGVSANTTNGKKIIYKEITTDYETFVEAYQCSRGDLFTPIPTNQQISFTQGEVLTICATSNNNDIVNVNGFEDLHISQSNSDDMYSYIVNGDYDSEIISTGCESSASNDGIVCYAEILLLSRFFREEFPLPLTVSGVVNLELAVYSDTRHLHTKDYSTAASMTTRRTQAGDDVYVASTFENLNVRITTEEKFDDKMSSGPRTSVRLEALLFLMTIMVFVF